MVSVSVIVPAYNAGGYLREAVESILSEDNPDIEVVLIDDGSTDGSVRTVEEMPIRILRQENGGEARARNAGVRAARGRYIAFLDADDLLAKGGLQSRMEFLDSNPSRAAVGGLVEDIIDEKGDRLAPVFQRMASKHDAPFLLTADHYRTGSFFPVCSSLYLYRKETFERIGLYDTSSPLPDCDFFFRLILENSIPILPIATFRRRLHFSNASLSAETAGPLAFNPGLVEAIRRINRTYGFNSDKNSPWESEYLKKP